MTNTALKKKAVILSQIFNSVYTKERDLDIPNLEEKRPGTPLNKKLYNHIE